MTAQIAVTYDGDAIATEAAALVAAAFAVPSLEMNAAYLAWNLGARFEADRHGFSSVARENGRLIGFIGAVPRPLRFRETSEIGFIASFLASAPDRRGGGLALAYYGALVEHIATLHAPVITFTIEGSPGDAVTKAVYQRAGFSGRRLQPMVTWGAVRHRLRGVVRPAEAEDVPTVELDRTAGLRSFLNTDPRGSRELSGGAQVTSAWRRTASGREPLLILELLPSPLNSSSLAQAVADGFAAFPDHGQQLTLPAMPDHLAPVAEGAGLRRMHVAQYHPSIWSHDPAHPFLRAERTTHPVL